MEVKQQKHSELDKVAAMIGEIRFAMMATAEEDGTLRSRPMSTLEIDEDGALWFFTAQDSPKVEEAARQRHVNLAYTRLDKQDYLSVSGSAETVRDRKRMEELWTPWIKPWFPGGLDDPNLVLLKVQIVQAEYWDAPGSKVKRLYGLAKAVATGKQDALGDHRKVQVR
ncbi:MAG: pyridoxamine 5'-phosphate oxidase family protein [Burkholderiaceae bacterium]